MRAAVEGRRGAIPFRDRLSLSPGHCSHWRWLAAAGSSRHPVGVCGLQGLRVLIGMAWAFAHLACRCEDLGHWCTWSHFKSCPERCSALFPELGRTRWLDSSLVRFLGIAGPSPSGSFRVSSVLSDLEAALM